MSLLGYDPQIYYKGRAAIEAVSMGIPVKRGEAVFRCNLVATKGGRMWSYCSGHIESDEARQLIEDLNAEARGAMKCSFYPGRGLPPPILKLKGHMDTTHAACTPPHDISDKAVAGYLPKGRGSRLLNRLMTESQEVLKNHPVNYHRAARGMVPCHLHMAFLGQRSHPQNAVLQRGVRP